MIGSYNFYGELIQKIEKANSQKRRSGLWLPEVVGGEGRKWMKVKKCGLPVIRQTSTGNVRYSMATTVSIVVWCI